MPERIIEKLSEDMSEKDVNPDPYIDTNFNPNSFSQEMCLIVNFPPEVPNSA